MGSLAYIIRDEEMDIPEPLCARPGDVFEVVEFLNHPPMQMSRGALAVVLVGEERQGWCHAISVQGEIYLAWLAFSANGLSVRLASLHPEIRSGVFPRKSFDILGCVVETYPTGDLNNRVLQFQEGMIFIPSVYERSFLTQKGPRSAP